MSLTACGCGNRPQGGRGEARRRKQRRAYGRQSGRKPMAVSLARPAPAPTAGSEAMSLKFDIRPTANPTSEKDQIGRASCREDVQIQAVAAPAKYNAAH